MNIDFFLLKLKNIYIFKCLMYKIPYLIEFNSMKWNLQKPFNHE